MKKTKQTEQVPARRASGHLLVQAEAQGRRQAGGLPCAGVPAKVLVPPIWSWSRVPHGRRRIMCLVVE